MKRFTLLITLLFGLLWGGKALAQTAVNGGSCAANSTSCTITVAATAGNSVVVFAARALSGTASFSVTDTNGDTFNSCVPQATNGSSSTAQMFCATFGTTNSSEVLTIYLSTSGYLFAVAEQYSGGFTTVDQYGSANVSGTSQSSGSVTTTQAPELIVGGVIDDSANNVTFTAGSGFTIRQSKNNANRAAALQDKSAGSAGAYASTTTSSAATSGGIAMVVTLYSSTVLAPTFSPNGGAFNAPQTVTISEGTPGANICYTTDGSTPTTPTTPDGTCTNGTQLASGGSVTVSSNSTINALGTKAGGVNSTVSSAAFTFTVATPVLTPAPGVIKTGNTLTITDATPGASIYYTADGTAPSCSSSLYSAPITIVGGSTYKATACYASWPNSSVAGGLYHLQPADPVVTLSGGTYTSVQTTTITDTTPNVTICYTLDGTTPYIESPGVCGKNGILTYSGAITIDHSLTLQTLATASWADYPTSVNTPSVAYTLNLPAANTLVFSPTAGTYTSYQTVSISGCNSGGTVYYTLDGTTPTRSSSVYGSPITLQTAATIKALCSAYGYSDAETDATFTINACLPPTSSPVQGVYALAQDVTLSSATSGALICYTIDGSDPVGSNGSCTSAQYSSPIHVSVTTMIKALATKTSWGNSAISSINITISSGSSVHRRVRTY